MRARVWRGRTRYLVLTLALAASLGALAVATGGSEAVACGPGMGMGMGHGGCMMGGGGFCMGHGGPGMRHGGPGHGFGGGGGADIMQLESLTDDQRDRIVALRDAAEKDLIELRSDLAAMRVDLHALLREQKPDRARVQELSRRMNDVRGQLQNRQLMLRLDIRNLLTPEQWEELKEMRHERRGEMMQHHPRGRRGHGRLQGWSDAPPPPDPLAPWAPGTEL